MTVTLEELAPCFQGLIPATLFTCSADGVPNVAYLSHVDFVDSNHVALSFQFFNKSRRNVAENPFALVRIIDPDTKRGYDLHLRFVRSERSGPLFESMRLRIEAIASFTGLKGIFRLIAADVYEVLAIEAAPEEPGDAGARKERERSKGAVLFSMGALQLLSDRIHGADCLDQLLDAVLLALEELFNFRHSMILLAGEQEGRVVAVATRGYGGRGIGAEVGYGEGIVGMVAEARQPIRISGLLREMLYAAAVREQASRQGLGPREQRVPLPGMEHPQSLLAVPLVVGDELLGVLFAESEQPYRFHEDDKACLVILGSYIAIAIQNALLRTRLEDLEPAPTSAPAKAGDAEADSRGGATLARHEISYYRSDECILVDGAYLVRSLPAKIFWRLLRARELENRTEFTNRELRLDKTLGLPAYKDNLETRLLLLRRRLERRCPDIRMVPRARGRFGLEVDCEIELVEHE